MKKTRKPEFGAEKIIQVSMVRTAAELYRSNPEFIRLCKHAGLGLEATLVADEQRIRNSLPHGHAIAIVRNRQYIEQLWAEYDSEAERVGVSWKEYCLDIDVAELVEKGIEAQEAVLEMHLRSYLQLLQESGIDRYPISLRQLGDVVGIRVPRVTNQIITKWLDEGKWLRIVEAGKPTMSRKANVYQLVV